MSRRVRDPDSPVFVPDPSATLPFKRAESPPPPVVLAEPPPPPPVDAPKPAAVHGSSFLLGFLAGAFVTAMASAVLMIAALLLG
jgi:hypothetical protein